MLDGAEPVDGIDAILNPRAVALVGASASPEKAGGRRWKTLAEGGFAGPLYPIHPKAAEILGRKAYPSVRDLPGPIDLAVIIVPPGDVPQVVADSLAQGAKGIVVITAGFGEISAAGKAVEAELARAVRAAGARMIGPNCAGLFSGPGRVNVVGWETRPGVIGLVSQSGNIALDFADQSRRTGVGFSRSVTIGNAADLKAFELVEYCFHDPATEVVLAYLEGFGPMEGRRLCEMVARAPVAKPMVILKPGRSESGRRAALSHTGSLAGEDRLVEAALRQHGILRAYEVEEAWQAAVMFANRVPMATDGVAVLTDGGGHATLFSDAAGLAGLSTPNLSEATRRALAALLPDRCPIANPVDFAGVAEGEPHVIPEALDICLADPAIGAAVMVGHFGGYERLGGPTMRPLEVRAAEDIAAVFRRHGKPVQVHSVHADSAPPAIQVLRAAGIPVHRAIEMPAKTLRHLLRATQQAAAGRPAAAPPAAPGPAVAMADAVGRPPWLQEPEARALLRGWGVAVPDWRVAATAAACADAAAAFGGAVVLKLIAPGAMHKSDIGGVLLDVRDAAAAAAGFRTLTERAAAAGLGDVRVLVTPMIRGAAELVVGAFRDAQFGPAIMVGLGGVLVELLDDVAFRLAPVTETVAAGMLEDLKGKALLRGYRGRPAVDTRAVPVLLARLSQMMAACPEIAEVDLNPVILADGEARIADARIVLQAGAR
ncbi:MAG: acetate--CoA ligase family protein [Alphaproteobacteria bacterium]|nr:acetate--CoA ligase family protein [Alphaproteobacteria bacterium]